MYDDYPDPLSSHKMSNCSSYRQHNVLQPRLKYSVYTQGFMGFIEKYATKFTFSSKLRVCLMQLGLRKAGHGLANPDLAQVRICPAQPHSQLHL